MSTIAMPRSKRRSLLVPIALALFVALLTWVILLVASALLFGPESIIPHAAPADAAGSCSWPFNCRGGYNYDAAWCIFRYWGNVLINVVRCY